MRRNLLTTLGFCLVASVALAADNPPLSIFGGVKAKDKNEKPVTKNVKPTIENEKTDTANEKSFTNSIGMAFNLIPAGVFVMGSPKSEEGRYEEEIQHKVRITKPYYLGVTEVTQKQWQEIMGTTPWQGRKYIQDGDDFPATSVDWNHAQEFIAKLNEKEGVTSYRLPTEAEWEFACRARSNTRYYFGDNTAELVDYAWYTVNADDAGERYPHKVGLKKPNRYGLYDMLGNVDEWCNDSYREDYYLNSPLDDPPGPAASDYRVLRGSSWHNLTQFVRCAFRGGVKSTNNGSNIGFRVARTQ